MKKFGLRLTGCLKCYFLIFVFFIFPNFKWLLSKILWKNGYRISSVHMKFYNVTNIFYLFTFDKETTAPLKFFETFTEMHFVSLFIQRERNITSSLLMIHLKCTVVYYDNINSSSINKPDLWAFKYDFFFFFRFLIYVPFNETFFENFMKKKNTNL